jgi:polysaccharide export outer membrane protein
VRALVPCLALAAALLAGAPARAQYPHSGGSLFRKPYGLRPALTNITVTPASLSGYVPDDKYKLRIGDKVSLQILEDRDLPRSLVVMDSGELEIPYIGRVSALDKTSKQLVGELKVKLEKEYYKRATVVLALDEANKLWGRIYVYGQVKTQGPIEVQMHENITAGKAILRAGGFGDFAKKTKVMIIRGGGASGGPKQIIELNMVKILEDGMIEQDVALQPEDSVVVPSRSWSI